MVLNLDVLDTFGGKISTNGNLYFFGRNDRDWKIIYPDLTSFETKRFFKIINPFEDILIQNIYCFRYIQEAILFFHLKKIDYFKNSLLIVLTNACKREIKSYLFKTYLEKKLNIPKLHFFHSEGNFDLTSLYLDLLDKDISYETVVLKNQNYLKVKYKSIELILSEEQQKKSKITVLLGINDKNFKVRNYNLSSILINKNLMW